MCRVLGSILLMGFHVEMVQYAVEDRRQHESGCDDKQKTREDRVGSCKNLSSRGFQLAHWPHAGQNHRRIDVRIRERHTLECTIAGRMLKALGLWCIIALVGLAFGMAVYCAFEGMSLADSYVNAAMILAGMGPMGELKTTAGKIFAGSYAIFSGLLLIIATGFVLAPIFHRILHHFHVETHEQD